MIRTLAVASLLMLPLAAPASEPQCKFSEARDLKLDLAGAKAVVFEVNQHDLVLQAGPGPAQLGGRACASNADWLGELTLTQQKVGDKLVVRLQRAQRAITLGGNSYAYLDIRGSVPDTVLVQLKVGSGDASVSGAHSLSADVGSGDVTLRGIKGLVTAAVGSGDVELDGAGSLNLLSVGSGDFKARNVRGNAKVGNVGSGDLGLTGVQGNVALGDIGSGDVDLRQVKGNVTIGTVGSGDVDIRNAGGNVSVERHGSGDVTVHDVGGSLTVSRSGSGEVRHGNVSGPVNLPRGK
ncbi:DUF4097 family beta strand repeat-containing protein [Stenotrophomonas rhizophila]|uniref:DUF4097 family beta strand repeat-containing protein n=1 Tax=Stenotrophomonas rhizophila TaxID=216778 RepID=UPI001E60356C|nr:DUF4097 family beta strand repeat-containing protein [Stenotrophomonas rhizophila]MCC7635487.1 DUF4097 family beta strand repeat protein [Stenotrophomonas rhizophila]MCC7664747.1 DUF4097 family beta strand repeat protein [Stenotrophomonas rhizophila]